MVLPTYYTTLNGYFVKRRVMVMGLIGTLSGLCSVALPMVIHKLMDLYGFRGCMAILAAINLHVFLGMVAMYPVEWYQKVDYKLVDKYKLHLEIKETDAQKKPIWYKNVQYCLTKHNIFEIEFLQDEDRRFLGFNTALQTSLRKHLHWHVNGIICRHYIFDNPTQLSSSIAIHQHGHGSHPIDWRQCRSGLSTFCGHC